MKDIGIILCVVAALFVATMATGIALIPFVGSGAVVAALLIYLVKLRGDWVIVAFAAGALSAILLTDIILDWWESRRRS